MQRWPAVVMHYLGKAVTGPASFCTALCLVGCASDSASASTRAEARIHREYCQALCGRLTACSAGYSLQSCMSLCENDPNRGRLNAQVWSGQIDCIAAQTCDALHDDPGSDTCLAVAEAALVPSDACIDFCLSDAAASFECGQGYSVEDCVAGQLCSWHDSVLGMGAACDAAADCEARTACLSNVFGP
jgi:hypothetical protein